MGLERMQPGIATHGLLAGSNLPSRFAIATGWCSPALPTKVYERSNPSGPSTFISQLSFARDPTIDTCHSPRLSLSTCSMRAAISPRVRGSPVFCHLDPGRHISCIVQSGQVFFSRAQPVQKSMNGALCRELRRFRAVKERVGRLSSPRPITSRNGLSQFLLKRARGRMICLGSQTRGAESAGKI